MNTFILTCGEAEIGRTDYIFMMRAMYIAMLNKQAAEGGPWREELRVTKDGDDWTKHFEAW